MRKPALTYENAHVAGWDAGNRSMRAAGRTAWNEVDWATACAAMARMSVTAEGRKEENRCNLRSTPITVATSICKRS